MNRADRSKKSYTGFVAFYDTRPVNDGLMLRIASSQIIFFHIETSESIFPEFPQQLHIMQGHFRSGVTRYKVVLD